MFKMLILPVNVKNSINGIWAGDMIHKVPSTQVDGDLVVGRSLLEHPECDGHPRFGALDQLVIPPLTMIQIFAHSLWGFKYSLLQKHD